MSASLLGKIHDKTAKMCVIGVGYVGLPLAMEMAEAGFEVTGIDLDQNKVQALNQGKSYIQDVESALVQKSLRAGKFRATTDFSVLQDADAISVCVPTPLRKTKDPDLSYIIAAVEKVEKYVKPETVIVLESTTYPGTTEEILGPAMERRGLKIGRDVFVAFSPERVDPGNKTFATKNTPKVIGGVTLHCGRVAAELYGNFVDKVILVSSAKAAEMAKLLENTFRAVNIGLVNEMAMMCDRMGIDIWEVIRAASTKPFGFMPFHPGPGIGGHCIPLDPQYLSWKAKTYDFYNRFIELASDINGNMPRYVVSKLYELLNSRGTSMLDADIMVLGVSYKKDIDDVRESPALEVIELLDKAGARVEYHDPFVPQIMTPSGVMRSVPFSLANASRYDCIILATDHTVFEMNKISQRAKLLFDTRNATAGLDLPNVVRLGDGWNRDKSLNEGICEAAAAQEE